MDNRLQLKVQLIATKTQILMLKADGYNWSMAGKSIADELDKTLVEIDIELENIKNSEPTF